ncbi:Olfactory receptor 5M10, partial [Sigmodon hispidus]
MSHCAAVAPKLDKVTEFILMGLTDDPELQVPLFVIFTLIYLITLTGNLGMMVLIVLDLRLHTPMYFFLSNLSFVDCVYTSAVTPKVIEGFLTGDKIISYNACAAQMFFFAAFVTIESFLLASMAFDRHAAVCKPLHYSNTMTTTMCVLLIAGSYINGLLQSSIHVFFTFQLSFCHSHVVNHFFCDIPPLLAISCSGIYTNEIVLFVLAALGVAFTLLVIFTSYLLIFVAILRMRSPEGRKKAISTCASHLTTVSIFYGTVIFMYLQPSTSHFMDTDKMASVFYTTVIPMLNPLVYSLRNKEVKNAFKKVPGNSSPILNLSFNRTCHDTQVILMENISEANEFFLVGLTDDPALQIPLFFSFTLIYLITLIGNLGMITLILLDSRLHTPMYFFLSNLSLVDCVYASAITPKVMEGFLTKNNIISYNACASQLFFFVAFAITESFILAVMAYDRHAAVCKPLHYTTTMKSITCILMVSSSYICGLLQSSIHVAFTFHLSFCHSYVINHFFCDIPPLLAISCSDTHTNEIVLFTLASFDVAFSLFVIFTSYILILVAILRIHSADGRKKAFSTCASHLTTVSIFFGTIIFMYLQPSSNHSMDTDKVASVFYTMVIPMLNPLVYSLRNKEVKGALNKVFGNTELSMVSFS